MAGADKVDEAAAELGRLLDLCIASPDGWGLRSDLDRALQGYHRECQGAAASAGLWVGIPAGLVWGLGQKLIFARADYGDFEWLVGTIGLLVPFVVAWVAGTAAQNWVISRRNARHSDVLAAAALALRQAGPIARGGVAAPAKM